MVKPFDNLTFQLTYNPQQLAVIRHSSEVWLSATNQTHKVQFKPGRVWLNNLSHRSSSRQTKVVKLHFKVLSSRPIYLALRKEGRLVDDLRFDVQ